MSNNFIKNLLKQNSKPVIPLDSKQSIVVEKEVQKLVFNYTPQNQFVKNEKPHTFEIQRDNIDKINLDTKDFYQKINDNSSKNLAIKCLNSVIGDNEVIRNKIVKRRFMFGKNLDKNFKKNNKKKIKKENYEEFKQIKFEVPEIEKLAKLWENYVEDLVLNESSIDSIKSKLLKADFHGAKITVLFSNNKNLIGKKGIVLKDNKNVFVISDLSGKVLVLQKRICVFEVSFFGKRFKIYGSTLENRVEERLKATVSFDHLYLKSKKLIVL